MQQLIYASTAHGDFSAQAAQHLARDAQQRNAALNVTGLLLFSARHFVQVLEGPAEVVNALYLRIAQDQRHQRVQLLSYIPSQRRQYPRWNMALAPLDEASAHAGLPDSLSALDTKAATLSDFNPYELDAVHVQLLLAKAATRLMRQALRHSAEPSERNTVRGDLAFDA